MIGFVHDALLGRDDQGQWLPSSMRMGCRLHQFTRMKDPLCLGQRSPTVGIGVDGIGNDGVGVVGGHEPSYCFLFRPRTPAAAVPIRSPPRHRRLRGLTSRKRDAPHHRDGGDWTWHVLPYHGALETRRDLDLMRFLPEPDGVPMAPAPDHPGWRWLLYASAFATV